MASSRLEGIAVGSGAARSVYEFSASLLDGRTVTLGEFQGRVLLIVNTASQCGLTPQYAGLENIYERFRDRGLEVLGFPCNQFGGQEPGSAEQIKAFCEESYGVAFPMFARIEVNGPSAHPLYQFLKKEKPGMLGIGRISWNFTKFLVNRQGVVAKRFGPATKPEALAGTIEQLLAEQDDLHD
jgi:glutathione peroxidase